MSTSASADRSEIRRVVKETYGRAASQAQRPGGTSCCGTGSSCGETDGDLDSITKDLYGHEQMAGLPAAAVQASLGCGNPTLLADLASGETVLDLGAGGGIDVLLAARRVGPEGFVYGLDMTPEMLALARRNQRDAGVTNVEFLRGGDRGDPAPGPLGRCDHLQLRDQPVDGQGPCPGRGLSGPSSGRTVRGIRHRPLSRSLDESLARDLDAWAGCVAGALLQDDYRARLDEVGFEQIEIEPTRVHRG